MQTETRAPILLRPARIEDAEWIVELVPRLHEFGPPAWRTVEQMNAAERADLTRALASLDDDETTTLIVAERSQDSVPLGFIYVATAVDFFTGERHAHIKDIVVAPIGEGQGVARRLLSAAEEWAKGRGYRIITLSVFPQNRRAVEVYEHIGYSTDVHRMLKPLE